MKKTLSAIMVVILCLSLCACSGVKQEVYDAAMSSYEAAKAGYDELSVKYDALKSKVEKYSTVIDALEKEDYDGAIAAVEAMRPAPEVTEVEITMDNLWDYFEITEERYEQTDAQGNLYQLQISSRLSLKNEYTLAEDDEYPTDVAVGYEYDSSFSGYYKPCTVDFETFTCNGIAWANETNHESKMAHFPQSAWVYDFFASNDPNYDANIRTVSNFNVLNASGTLYLVNK